VNADEPMNADTPMKAPKNGDAPMNADAPMNKMRILLDEDECRYKCAYKADFVKVIMNFCRCD
jgi:hypothetical protein